MKRTIRFLLTMLLAVSAIACSSDNDADSASSDSDTSSDEASSPEAEPYEISLATFKSVGGLGSFTAKEAGIFERHGLDVELISLSVENLLPSLQSGTTEVVPQVLSDVIQYWQRDGDIRIISPLNEGIVYFLNAASDSDIPVASESGWEETMKALEGKSLGVIGGPESGNAKILQALMRDAGADPDQVEWVQMQTGGPMVAALTTDQVDVVYGDTSTALAAEAEGAKRVFDFSKDADPLTGLVYATFVTSEAILEDMPDLMERFNAAIQETYEFMNDPDNADELERIATEVVDLPDSPTLAESIQAQLYVQSADVDQAQAERSIEFLIDAGIVPSEPEPTPTDLYHPGLLDS